MKTLITSALPYVNNIPHLGNLIGSTLSADVYARHCRLAQGKGNVLYVCGADEHGTATETKAREENISEQELCDKYEAIHRQIYEWFHLSFDVWGRTHTQTHERIVQDLFTQLDQNGYIYSENTTQLFDSKEQQFLADRYVEGTCPYCSYPEARGDQCDNCGKLIHAPDLINPVSKLSGETPVLKETTHLFLDLPKLKPQLQSWFDQRKEQWSVNDQKVTQHWIDNLQARTITRDLKWGVSVPKEGFENKVFYVWFDAPIGYISITAHAREDWKEWWHSPDVRLVQFMGKDNLIFHSIIFPATQLGSGESWTTLEAINSTEYLNLQGGKFSKSRHEGIFGDDCIAIEEKYGITTDYWRYYLLATRPEHSDSTFSFEDFQSRTNNEVIANIGNFAHRLLHFISRNIQEIPRKETFDELLEAVSKEQSDHSQAAKAWIAGKALRAKSKMQLEQGDIRESLHTIFTLGKLANTTFQQAEPWKTITSHKEQALTDLYVLFHLLREIATLLSPYLPSTSKKIFDMMGLPSIQRYDELDTPVAADAIAGLNEPSPLFARIEDETKEKLQQEYGVQTTPLRLTVAEITSAKLHPNADKLYVLDLNLGDRSTQIVSGLREHYTLEELPGKHIILVNNLAPATIRGVESKGMLLAGESKQGVGLLCAPNTSPGTDLKIGNLPVRTKQITFEEFTKQKILFENSVLTINGIPSTGIEFKGEKNISGNLR